MIETYKNDSMQPPIVSELMKCLQEGVLILNMSNIVETVNVSALAILGYSPQENLIGKHISQIQAGTDEVGKLFMQLAADEGRNGHENSNEVYDHPNDVYSIRVFRENPDSQPIKMIVLRDILSTNKKPKR